MNVVQYYCKDCGHYSRMCLEAPGYDPRTYCPRAICETNGQMTKIVLAYVEGYRDDKK